MSFLRASVMEEIYLISGLSFAFSVYWLPWITGAFAAVLFHYLAKTETPLLVLLCLSFDVLLPPQIFIIQLYCYSQSSLLAWAFIQRCGGYAAVPLLCSLSSHHIHHGAGKGQACSAHSRSRMRYWFPDVWPNPAGDFHLRELSSSPAFLNL